MLMVAGLVVNVGLVVKDVGLVVKGVGLVVIANRLVVTAVVDPTGLVVNGMVLVVTATGLAVSAGRVAVEAAGLAVDAAGLVVNARVQEENELGVHPKYVDGDTAEGLTVSIHKSIKCAVKCFCNTNHSMHVHTLGGRERHATRLLTKTF